jgi:hypothetical protein
MPSLSMIYLEEVRDETGVFCVLEGLYNLNVKILIHVLRPRKRNAYTRRVDSHSSSTDIALNILFKKLYVKQQDGTHLLALLVLTTLLVSSSLDMSMLIIQIKY